MKVLINYLIQVAGEHSHYSEILEIDSPPYSFSSDLPVSTVLEWKDERKIYFLKVERLL